MNQVNIHEYLKQRDQLVPARLLWSGYYPLRFVFQQGLHAIAPLAMILGFPFDLLQPGSESRRWLGSNGTDDKEVAVIEQSSAQERKR